MSGIRGPEDTWVKINPNYCSPLLRYADNGYSVELVDREGGFAYNVPAGWRLIDNPARRYTAMSRFKMAVDPKSNPRIVVTVGYDWTLLSLADQRNIVIQAFHRELTPAEFKMAKQSIIETASKQRAIRFFFQEERKTEYSFTNGFISSHVETKSLSKLIVWLPLMLVTIGLSGRQ